MRPETRFVECGGVDIAFQVAGDGPQDLLFVPGWISNIDLFWEYRRSAEFFGRLASFSRLIIYDKPGTGLSDPVESYRRSRSAPTRWSRSWTRRAASARRWSASRKAA